MLAGLVITYFWEHIWMVASDSASKFAKIELFRANFQKAIKCQCCPHIEISQLIYKSIDWFLYEGNTGT